ncbi:MAG: peptidylprolyl isomerase [Actinomycetota bacterium]
MTDRRQRQKDLRAGKREAERKAAARRELRRRIVIALVVGLGLVIVLVIFATIRNRPEELPAAYDGFRAQTTACGGTPPPEPQLLTFTAPEDEGVAASARATITTSCGPIVIELDPGYPQTVNSFVFLARQGFYDGIVFHRVASQFVIQGGDPTATGTGGPGYLLPDEFPPADFVYEPGVVAMANAGRGTTGSQFFIVVGDDAKVLTNSFSILGRVVEGQSTLETITAIPTELSPGTNERSRPTETIYIEVIEIDG